MQQTTVLLGKMNLRNWCKNENGFDQLFLKQYKGSWLPESLSCPVQYYGKITHDLYVWTLNKNVSISYYSWS